MGADSTANRYRVASHFRMMVCDMVEVMPASEYCNWLYGLGLGEDS